MPLACDFDSGFGDRARLGLVVLETDETIEADMRSVFDLPGVALFHSRIPFPSHVTPETLAAMADAMPPVLSLLPRTVPIEVLGYGCTSASTVIGPDRVAEIVNGVHPSAAVTNPISAIIAACRALAVSKLALVTPYSAEVSQKMIDVLEANGIAIVAFGTFEQTNDPDVARISPASIRDAMVDIGGHAEAEAVFASCTNLNTFSIIDDVESRLGKPALTSNQALAWHMANLAGLAGEARGPGRLFET